MHAEWVLNLVRGVEKVIRRVCTLMCWVCNFQEHLTKADCQQTLKSLSLRNGHESYRAHKRYHLYQMYSKQLRSGHS